MKLAAIGIIVGGWLLAVGGLVTTDGLTARMIAALLGLAASLGGIGALNATHVANAPWKARGN